MKPSERPPSGGSREPHPILFDLPLEDGRAQGETDGPVEREAEGTTEAETRRSRRARRSEPAADERRLPLFDASPLAAAEAVPRPAPRRGQLRPVPPRLEDDQDTVEPDVSLAKRVGAGTADVVIVAAWTALVGGAAVELVGPVEPVAALPVVGFGALFSFVYTVLPLALWRRTAGMALTGLYCTGDASGALSIGQGARRWVGGLLTVAGLGLPAALMVTGRSLGDRLSGSRVEGLVSRSVAA